MLSNSKDRFFVSRGGPMSAVLEKAYTPEDLLAMPDRKSYELVDGHLVERNVSVLSSWVGTRMCRVVDIFVEEHGIGWVWGADLGYVCFPNAPGKVRKPDVSFVRKERLPEGLTSEGYLYIPPDLAVEVISPNDLAYEVDHKVDEYLGAGVPLIWVINPEARTVFIYRRDLSITRLREQDELSGEDILPGFRCHVSTIFPPKPAGQQATPSA
jgi:Uma2 family endonuclease